MANSETQSPFQFPCEFPIKAIGRAGADLEQVVYSTVQVHAPEVQAGDLTAVASSGGAYLSVTVRILAQSRAQLDAIYQDLNAHEAVLWTL